MRKSKFWRSFIFFLLISAVLSTLFNMDGVFHWAAALLYFFLVAVGLVTVFDWIKAYRDRREDDRFAADNRGYMIKVDGLRFGSQDQAVQYMRNKYGVYDE